MRRTPVVLLAIAALLVAGLAPAPRAEADCHKPPPDVKALRKAALAAAKRLNATVRPILSSAKKYGKELAGEVRRGTKEPGFACSEFLGETQQFVEGLDQFLAECFGETQAQFESACTAAGPGTPVCREYDPGCGGAADILYQKTRDCMELCRDGLAAAFEPLRAASHCEGFDVNLTMNGPGPLLHPQVVRRAGDPEAAPFRTGDAVFSTANCLGEFELFLRSPGSGHTILIFDASAHPVSGPVAEMAVTVAKGEVFLAGFAGLPPGEYYYFVLSNAEVQEANVDSDGRSTLDEHPDGSATVPAWEAAPIACTVTDVHLTVDGVEEDLGPWSSVLVDVAAGGNIAQIWVTFLQSGAEDSFEFFFEPATPVNQATVTVSPTDPPDTFYAHTNTWQSIVIEEIEIIDIGNLLDDTPGSVTTIHFSGYALDGVSGTHHPCSGTICLAGANATLSTVP